MTSMMATALAAMLALALASVAQAAPQMVANLFDISVANLFDISSNEIEMGMLNVAEDVGTGGTRITGSLNFPEGFPGGMLEIGVLNGFGCNNDTFWFFSDLARQSPQDNYAIYSNFSVDGAGDYALDITAPDVDPSFLAGRAIVLHSNLTDDFVACGGIEVNADNYLAGYIRNTIEALMYGRVTLALPGDTQPVGYVDVFVGNFDDEETYVELTYEFAGLPPNSTFSLVSTGMRGCNISLQHNGTDDINEMVSSVVTDSYGNVAANNTVTQATIPFNPVRAANREVSLFDDEGTAIACGELILTPFVNGYVYANVETGLGSTSANFHVNLVGLEMSAGETPSHGSLSVQSHCDCDSLPFPTIPSPLFSYPGGTNPWSSSVGDYVVDQAWTHASLDAESMEDDGEQAEPMGTLSLSFTVSDYSSIGDLAGHTFVVEGSTGVHIGCGNLVCTGGSCVDHQACTPTPTPFPPQLLSAVVIGDGEEGTGAAQLSFTSEGPGITTITGMVVADSHVGLQWIVHDGYLCDNPDESEIYGVSLPQTGPVWPAPVAFTSNFWVMSTHQQDLGGLLGRVITLRDADFNELACGNILATNIHYATSQLYSFEDWTGNATTGTATITGYGGYNVTGTVEVSFQGDDDVGNYEYDLAGLNPNEQGGIHVHVGRTCNISHVGAHYYVDEDPWTNSSITGYVSSSDGTASGSFSVADGYDADMHVSHAVVVHAESGEKAACGQLVYAPWAQGYFVAADAGNVTVPGTSMTVPSITIAVTLSFLERNDPLYESLSTGVVEIDSSCSCEYASTLLHSQFEGLSGQSFEPIASYTVDAAAAANSPGGAENSHYAEGQAQLVATLAGFALNDVNGHAVIVRASNGDALACGLVECGTCAGVCVESATATPSSTTSSSPSPSPSASPSEPAQFVFVSTKLCGTSADNFNNESQTAFREAVANVTGVNSDDVEISSIVDVGCARKSTGGIDIDYIITLYKSVGGGSVNLTSVTDALASSSPLENALQDAYSSRGLTYTITGVEIDQVSSGASFSQTPSVTPTISVTPSASPSSSPPPPEDEIPLSWKACLALFSVIIAVAVYKKIQSKKQDKEPMPVYEEPEIVYLNEQDALEAQRMAAGGPSIVEPDAGTIDRHELKAEYRRLKHAAHRLEEKRDELTKEQIHQYHKLKKRVKSLKIQLHEMKVEGKRRSQESMDDMENMEEVGL